MRLRRDGSVAGALMAALLLAGCTAAPQPEPTATSIPSPAPTAAPTSTAEPPSLRVVDTGPRYGAMGPVTVDADGDPETYTVVEGDYADPIRVRFDIWWDQLADENGVRLDRSPELQPGDVLTFTGSLVAHEEEPP